MDGHIDDAMRRIIAILGISIIPLQDPPVMRHASEAMMLKPLVIIVAPKTHVHDLWFDETYQGGWVPSSFAVDSSNNTVNWVNETNIPNTFNPHFVFMIANNQQAKYYRVGASH